jgi:hypothetical protein
MATKKKRKSPKPRKPQAPPKFSVGDQVRVKYGIADPDFSDIPLGGWAGTITEVDQRGRSPLYLIEWNQSTLDNMHPICRKRCERDGLEETSSWQGEEDLETDVGEPVPMEQPTNIVTDGSVANYYGYDPYGKPNRGGSMPSRSVTTSPITCRNLPQHGQVFSSSGMSITFRRRSALAGNRRRPCPFRFDEVEDPGSAAAGSLVAAAAVASSCPANSNSDFWFGSVSRSLRGMYSRRSR